MFPDPNSVLFQLCYTITLNQQQMSQGNILYIVEPPSAFPSEV